MLTGSQIMRNPGSPTNSMDGDFMCEMLIREDCTHESSYGDGTSLVSNKRMESSIEPICTC